MFAVNETGKTNIYKTKQYHQHMLLKATTMNLKGTENVKHEHSLRSLSCGNDGHISVLNVIFS